MFCIANSTNFVRQICSFFAQECNATYMSSIKFLNAQELFVNPVSIYLRKPCNLVWASTYRTNLIRLEILQKRVIRTIAKTTFEAHTDPIFQNLGILKFHDIYLIQLDLFMYSYQNHTLPVKFHCKFTKFIRIIQETRVNFVCLSVVLEPNNFPFFYQGPKFYNTLNTNIIKASSPFSFKRALKEFICNNY